MNVLSLFSGIGGLELGLERAGMTVVGQVEIDPFCRRVLAKHWPEVPRHDDVRTCVEWWRGERRPAVHVVVGGFPCQPVSNAGKRLGEDDERWLWPAFLAVVRDLRPSYALMENVAALLGRGAGTVLGDLAEIGYDAEWDCIPAAAVGAPHRRDRWFAVAYPGTQAGRGISAGRRQQQPEGGRSAGTAAYAACRRATDESPRDRREQVGAVDRAGGGVGGRDTAARGGEPGRCPGVVAALVADAGGPRLEGPRQLHHPRATGWPRPDVADGGWWATEPGVDRVAHGVSGRVDRLRSLGNAVVPQVAEYIGRLILAADRESVAS